MKKILFFKILFLLAMIGLVTFIIIFMLYVYDVSKKDKLSSNLAKSYSIAFLYSGNTPYSLSLQNDNSTSSSDASDSSLYSSQFQSLNSDSNSDSSSKYNSTSNLSSSLNHNSTSGSKGNSSDSFVIGIIKIDKIKLDYPILSDVSDELLKIAPCRFAGPLPNKIGNLCIAGHNYIDNTSFAQIVKLTSGDTINIYGLDGKSVEYHVTEKKEVEGTDFSCTSQFTNGKRIVTLMTCNSIKQTRVIIRAEE